MNTSIYPKIIISDVLFRQTGVDIQPKQIDFITAYNIAQAVIALDYEFIDRQKFDSIIVFSINMLLEREGYELFFKSTKSLPIVKKMNFDYAETFLN